MQLLIESIYEDDEKKKIIRLIPNWGILPDYQEIDIIIEIFEGLKEKMTNKEINEYNKKSREIMIDNARENNNRKELIIKQEGYIYLLKSKNLYKIGRTKCLKDRMKSYTTENPFGVRLIIQKKVNDYIGIESKLLKKLKDKQVKGEWFKLDKKDILFIKNYLKAREI